MERNFIGSSDIAAVLGLSRWCTPLKLWAEKTGKIEPDDLSDNEAVEWGKRLEEIVAQKFADTHNVKLMAYKKRFSHPEHEFLTCELDRIITGTETIVEVKTCSAWKAKEWEDEEIPTEYILQVQFAMGLSKRKHAFIAVLVGGNRYVEKELDFDEEIFENMVEKAVEFWDMVQKDIAPVAMIGDKDTLAALFPEEKEERIFMEGDKAEVLEKMFKQRKHHQEEMKRHEKIKEKAENAIKEIIQGMEGIETEKYVSTWKAQTRTYADVNRMREDGIYEKYSYETSSRVLRVREKKE